MQRLLTSVVVTSAPSPQFDAAVGLNFVGAPLSNSFTVSGGAIVNAATSFLSTVAGFTLNFGTSGGIPTGSLTGGGNLVDSGATGEFSILPSSTSTPEPTSVITLIGIGVLGVASKLKKKA